jgi:hypothetical protein
MKIAMPTAEVVGWPRRMNLELRKRRAIVDSLWRGEDERERFNLIERILKSVNLTHVEFAELVLDVGQDTFGMRPTRYRRIEPQQDRKV